MGYFSDVDDFVAGREKRAAGIPILSAGADLIKVLPTAVGALFDKASPFRTAIEAHPYSIAALIGGGVAAPYAYRGVKGVLTARKQDQVFNDVKRTDPVLQEANVDELNSAFETFRNYAPSLATDPNATRSFLREAVTSGGGVSYNTINLLAKTENAITGSDD